MNVTRIRSVEEWGGGCWVKMIKFDWPNPYFIFRCEMGERAAGSTRSERSIHPIVPPLSRRVRYVIIISYGLREREKWREWRNGYGWMNEINGGCIDTNERNDAYTLSTHHGQSILQHCGIIIIQRSTLDPHTNIHSPYDIVYWKRWMDGWMNEWMDVWIVCTAMSQLSTIDGVWNGGVTCIWQWDNELTIGYIANNGPRTQKQLPCSRRCPLQPFGYVCQEGSSQAF